MGNRFRGGIQKDAMPPLHRYFGNPALTCMGRLFFQSPVGDFYCGLRGFRKEAYETHGTTHHRHGVRHRDGCEGDAAASCGSPKCRPRSRPTGAAVRRICGPGATVGALCGSFCSTARAGCSCIRGCCSWSSEHSGRCGCCPRHGLSALSPLTCTPCFMRRPLCCSAFRRSPSRCSPSSSPFRKACFPPDPTLDKLFRYITLEVGIARGRPADDWRARDSPCTP